MPQNKTQHAVLVKICTRGSDQHFLAAAMILVLSEKSYLQIPSFISLNKWNVEGDKSKLYVMVQNLQHNTVFKLTWGLTLLCYERNAFFFSGMNLEIQALRFSQHCDVSQSWCFVLIPWKSDRSCLSYPKQTVHITVFVMKIFFHWKIDCHHFRDSCFDSSLSWHHILSLVVTQFRKASASVL